MSIRIVKALHCQYFFQMHEWKGIEGLKSTRSNGFMELAACLFEVDFSCLVPSGCNEGAMGVPWKWHRVHWECLL